MKGGAVLRYAQCERLTGCLRSLLRLLEGCGGDAAAAESRQNGKVDAAKRRRSFGEDDASCGFLLAGE